VLWKQPISTLFNASAECLSLLGRLCQKLKEKSTTVLGVSLVLAGLYYLYITEGSHSALLRSSEKEILWGLYWIWLGVLSSVGLGTGLHTFLLFLGPLIARVTLAAYECGTTDFPEPPYPNEVNCPEEPTGDSGEVTIWMIMAKVRFPAMCWGAGTALGELPPYFFDLAGITCGHFLIPFWTFFGATLIGKAVVKMHIQKVFIIFLFSKHHVDSLLDIIKSIPVLGPLITDPIEAFFTKQQAKLRSGAGEDSGNVLGQVFEVFIFAMVAYFIVTIVNSLAQSRLGRQQKKQREAK